MAGLGCECMNLLAPLCIQALHNLIIAVIMLINRYNCQNSTPVLSPKAFEVKREGGWGIKILHL